MTEDGKSNSSWLPPVDLEAGSREQGARGAEAPEPESGRTGRSRRRFRLVSAALIAVALAAGVAVGVTLSEGEPASSDSSEPLTLAEEGRVPSGEVVLGKLGPSKALTLAAAVGIEDDRSERAGETVFSDGTNSAIAATTTTTIRAKYVLRLAAVAALLRELGNHASNVATVRGSAGDAKDVREALARLDAVAGDYSDSVYGRSRKLDASVAATILRIERTLVPGGEHRLRRLGTRLEALGDSVALKLDEAAAKAVEGRTVQAGRQFSAADRRLGAFTTT